VLEKSRFPLTHVLPELEKRFAKCFAGNVGMNPNHFPAYFGDVPVISVESCQLSNKAARLSFTNLDITIRLRLGDGIIYTIAIQFLDGTSAEPQKSLRRKRSTSASMSKH